MASTALSNIRQWARLGAEQRLHQLHQEIASIHGAFPELRRGVVDRAPAAATPQHATEGAAPRRRRKMSAQARRRISEAQKARWAKQKAGKK
jgi:hypothetical protein